MQNGSVASRAERVGRFGVHSVTTARVPATISIDDWLSPTSFDPRQDHRALHQDRTLE